MTNSGANRGIRPAGASGRRPGGRVVGRDRGHVAAAPAPVPLRVTGNAVSADFFRRSVRPGRPEGGGGAAPPARRGAGLPLPGSKTPGRRLCACAGGRLDRSIILLISYTPPKKVRAAAIFWHLAVFPSVFGAVPSRCRPSFAPDCPARYDFPDVAQKGGGNGR